MDAQWLRQHVDHLKQHLDHFEQIAQQLEDHYQHSLLHIHDAQAKATLMENYNLQLNRQKESIQAMTKLYHQARQQLIALNA